MVSVTAALIHCLQRTFSDRSGSFPVGSSVVCKGGGILFWQYSCGRGFAVRYITRFELDGAASSPLPVGGPALLCVYCPLRSWEIKCHSWRHFSFRISAVSLASSLCVSYSNIGTSLGLGPAACSLDQKCQFYLSNGLASSTRRVYRSAQRQFMDFCTLDGCQFKWFVTAHEWTNLAAFLFPPSGSFTSLFNKGLPLGNTVLAHRSGFPRSLGELPPTSAPSSGH